MLYSFSFWFLRTILLLLCLMTWFVLQNGLWMYIVMWETAVSARRFLGWMFPSHQKNYWRCWLQRSSWNNEGIVWRKLGHIIQFSVTEVSISSFLFILLLNCFHSFIQLACAEFNDSLLFSGASSVPLFYVLFPAPFFSYSSILSHLILPSISWSTFQSCCFQIHI